MIFKKLLPRLVLNLFIINLFFVSVGHAADINKGAKTFAEECAECHSVKQGKNKKGPFLWGIANRKAASIADFNYSDTMKQSGIIWTADKIDAYIFHPKQIVPAGKMKYEGLGSAEDRANVIEYLSSLH